MRKPITDWDAFRKQFIKNELRRATWKWPANRQVIIASRVGRKANPKTGRMCWYVVCAKCDHSFLDKEIEVDHVNPVVPVQGVRNQPGSSQSALDTGTFVLRLLAEPKDLQVLCQSCHARKTSTENTARRAIRRILKGVNNE